MRALTWHGRHDVRVDSVPDPEIVNPRDAIIKISSTAICGSDLHLFDGYIPTMRAGDILGHENMGEVVEVGSKSTLKKGQRVVIPFTVSCGSCFHCSKQQFSACDNSNPASTSDMSETLYGYPMGGAFGYAHLTGGYAGGQAEYLRVPYSDIGPVVIPDGLTDDQVLFLSDILPTGWMGAVNAEIEAGDTVAVWGCGPVGLFAIQSAFVLGAHRVIGIDHYPHRLELAKQKGAEILDFREVDVREALFELTGGIGPDACIECVGMEAHGLGIDNLADHAKVWLKLGTDRPAAFRQAILACRKGGRVSVPGVYGGMMDKFPIGAFMEKGLTMKTGQTHVQKYTERLMEMIEAGSLDTTWFISHHASLENGPDMYRHWHDEQDSYTKIILKPDLPKGDVKATRETKYEPA
jgi:threonine dehydrogenase-like Zn-dependent dehydrogenase